jgi:hypothetical protein
VTRPYCLIAGGPHAPQNDTERFQLIREMDGNFRAAMMKAARAGLERPPLTGVSTVACTRRPIFVDRPLPESRGGGSENTYREKNRRQENPDWMWKPYRN